MTPFEKLTAIRGLMKQHRIDAYIIPSSDPHISEYLPDRYQSIAWVSGFTGSAGTLVITQQFAGLWTDSRYFVQATEQLADTGFELVGLRTQGAAEYADWLAGQLSEGAVVAFDGKLASVSLAHTVIEKLTPLSIVVKANVDLLDPLWVDRPILPKERAYLIDEKTAGRSTLEKLQQLRRQMSDENIDAHFISSLDDLAWLFNIRGSDVTCNPVVLGFALITADTARLFIDRSKMSRGDHDILQAQGVVIDDYNDAGDVLAALPSETTLLLDPKRTCFALYECVGPKVFIVEKTNPTSLFKAVKNEMEIGHIRDTMVKDGIALTRFFKWLEEAVAKETITERSLAEKLISFRAEQHGFVGESFKTIAGYKAHGALPHYQATLASDSQLQSEGLLLIDSGGQYRTGTTDITRVIPLGDISAAEKVDYTLVLKGMIEGSMTVFPTGTRGYQIDAITRKPLWDHLRNYGHGTGHGVGFFLNVHEGPHVLNPSNVDVPLESGMISSIEPGLYREGQYGIRIENLVLTVNSEVTEFGSFMAFDTLTLCYIDTRAIDNTLLETKHINWLNAYHANVLEKLHPLLTEPERRWLEEKTKPI